jgi:hypothetical protein
MATKEQIANAPKILYGQMTYCGKTKIGSFRLEYNRWSDKQEYLYYGEKGRRGVGGFTIPYALHLLQEGRLSTNPAYGKKENYI